MSEPMPVSEMPTLGPARAAPRTEVAFGDYLLLEEIGRGGMGVVYKAVEPGLGGRWR